MPYKDFVAGATLTAAEVDTYLMRQTVMTFASAAARDAALSGVLTEGMYAYLTDSNTLSFYTGSVWTIVHEPPQQWTPVVTQNGTRGTTIYTGRYQRSHDAFRASAYLEFTNGGTSGNAIQVTLPLTLVSQYGAGGAFMYQRTGVTVYTGTLTSVTTTVVELFVSDAGSLGVSPAFAVASGDLLQLSVTGFLA